MDAQTTARPYEESLVEAAAKPEVRALVFDLLSRGEVPTSGIRDALQRAGYHPGAWYVLRREWSDHLTTRAEVVQTRDVYSLRVGP